MSEEFGEYEVVAEDPLKEAGDEADAKAFPFPDPDMALCPVVPLGFEGAKVVFAMPEGEIRREVASKVRAMLRTDIFVCQAGQSFLTNWRNAKNEFMGEFCAVWFVRKCRQAGQWDSSRPMRGLGVWPGEGEQLVLHVGDRVWRYPAKGRFEDLSVFEALRERRGPLYRLRPPAPRPTKACSLDDAQWALDWLRNWNFEPIGTEGLTGADLVAGHLMAGLLGGFAPFRGHLLIHALHGSGKTELMLFVHALISALAGEVIDSFTEAGLKNDLAGNARPVLIDEAESGTTAHGPGAVEKALEILRRMATGKGGNRVQGDIGGGTVNQTAVGAAMLAGITPPKLGPADASRFVEIRLSPLSGALASRAELEAAKARAKALAPSLLGRALKGAWRYRADLEAVTHAMVVAGETPRSADLVAMLIAGRRLLLFDDAMTPDEAAEEVRRWRPLLEARAATEVVSNVGLDAMAHLMAAESGIHMKDRRMSVGSLIHRWVTHDRSFSDALLAMGLKVTDDPGPDGREGHWLLVANHHPRLDAIFKGTEWADYRRSLGYLDTVGPDHRTWASPNSIRFGMGIKQRALAIPLAPWVEPFPSASSGPGPDRRSGVVPGRVPDEDIDWPDENV